MGVLVGLSAVGLALSGAPSEATPEPPAAEEADFQVTDDGTPVAVTYCPLCRSGLVFDRRVNGTTLEFGVSGKLLNANLVMYDRQTETYWSQLDGSAVVGPLVPRQLTVLPNTVTTWAEWRESHPDTEVLSRNTGIYPKSNYGSNPYGGYADREGVGFGVDDVDDRGTRWNFDGVALEGPHEGSQPEQLNSHGIFWFAWSEFNPETEIYGE